MARRLSEEEIKARADRAERKASEPKHTGRPSSFTQTLADQICERIASGKSVRALCEEKDMPSKTTVMKWLGQFPAFADQYARACEERAENYAEDIVNIADTEQDPQKARVMIDARKWVASKLLPKKYGDRIDMNLSGSISLTDDQIESRITQLLGKGRTGEPAGGT